MVCVYTNLDHVILFTALGFKIHQSLLSKNNHASKSLSLSPIPYLYNMSPKGTFLLKIERLCLP